MSFKVLLADDHQLFREGLKALLNKNESVEVIAEANNGQEALELSSDLKPDIIVMDVSMAGLNGIEATREIKKLTPEIMILALSMHADKESVKSMLKAGASGYVLKSSAFEDLNDAIIDVLKGKVFISKEIADVVFEDYTQILQNDDEDAKSPLTDREKEVLMYLAEGKNSKEISELCFISASTVDSHRKKIMVKLDIHSIAELTKYAIKEGLTKLN